MAQKHAKKPGNDGWRGFVNYYLSKDEKEAIKSETFDREQFASQVERLTSDGYSIKFLWDDYNRCFQCVVMTQDRENPNYGLALSGRGTDPLKALKQFLYVHDVVMLRNWNEWFEQGSRFEIDD